MFSPKMLILLKTYQNAVLLNPHTFDFFCIAASSYGGKTVLRNVQAP